MSSKPRLADPDFARAAARLGVDVPTIKAVTAVEARGQGFYPDGHPLILFERHIFHRETRGRFGAQAPDLSSPSPGGYGPSNSQPQRLERAAKLDRNAALRSTSWGLFQIMGFNHPLAGHPTLQGFINAMFQGESQQLDAFVSFVSKNPRMVAALQGRDWATFARLYNGPNYKINAYDTKLAQAYLKNGGHP